MSVIRNKDRQDFRPTGFRPGWRGPILGALLLSLTMSCGCAPLTSGVGNWFTDESKSVSVVPDRIMPIWTDTVLHQPNQPGVRGFGGRIYFYKNGADTPIAVDGSLTVYVFDGNYKAEDATRPIKKYIITASQLKDLESKTALGVSYNVWIPWEEVGGPSRKLTLIARFDGIAGGTVISESSNKLLPGIDSPANEFRSSTRTGEPNPLTPLKHSNVPNERNPIGDRASQANYQQPDRSRTKNQENTIFSINLPSSLERKINAAGSSPPQTPTLSPTPAKKSESPSKEVSPTNNLRSDFTTEQLSNTIHSPDSASVRPGITNGPTTPGNDANFSDSPASHVELGRVGSAGSVSSRKLQAHFGPRRYRARNESAARREPFAIRTQPHPATWQSGLQPTPRHSR